MNSDSAGPKPGLLDVNVLIALFDPAHPHHEEAHDWFGRHQRQGWATCTLTINGCVRILSGPSYPSFRATTGEVIARLRQFCQSPLHRFWPDQTNLLDSAVFRTDLIGSHAKVTDVSLLALACANGGRLITFDRSIPIRAVAGARSEDLFVIGEEALRRVR